MTKKYLALVDDEAIVRRALSRLLRLSGYEVMEFPSGQEFIDSLGTRVPDLVALDMHMPGLSGLQVCDYLVTSGSRLPVVCMTASEDVELEKQVVLAGASALLRKPFSRRVLLEALDSALGSNSPNT